MDTWGWNGCGHLEQGSFICLSNGKAPMPMALPQAICGPQVPGTARPSNMADLASLNPCPSAECVSPLFRGGCNLKLTRIQCTTDGLCVKKGTEQCISSIVTISSSTSLLALAPNDPHTSTLKKTTKTEGNGKLGVTSTTTIRVTVPTNKTTATTTKEQRTTHSSEKSETKVATTSTHSTRETMHSTSTHSITTEITRTSKTTKSATTTSAVSTTSSKPWEIAIYSESDCAGDYYLVSGHNVNVSKTCITLRGGKLSTEISSTAISCRWYTEGGFGPWTDCASSPLKSPKSWYISNGICSVLDDANCKGNDGIGMAYYSWDGKGCRNWAKFDPIVWGSMHCSIDP